MVGDEKDLAQDGLPVSPGNSPVEIGFGMGDEIFDGLQIFLEGRDACGPGLFRGRGFGCGPIFLGPFAGNIFWVAAELEEIPLGQAHVLQEHPCSVGEVSDFDAGELDRPIADGRVKIGVRLIAFQKGDELMAQGLVGRC